MPPDDLSRLPLDFGRAALGGTWPAPLTEPGRMEPGLPAAVLRALAAMARISKRQQAELDVALRRAGLILPLSQQAEALRHLCETASVEDVIPLDDGGVLLSVTSAGMERASR